MGKSALNDVQKGIFDVLTADSTLTGLVTGIFDHVPKGQAFPYVNIGDTTETIFNTFGKQGRDVTETIHVYSEHEGYKEVNSILSRVVELLDYTSIALTENDLVYIRYDNGLTSLFEIDNGRTRVASGRFRVIVQEK